MTSSHRLKYLIRPADRHDIDGICELINAYSWHILGIPRDARRDVVMTWEQPGFDVNTDTRVIVLPDGRIVGYGEVEATDPPFVHVGSWLRVHPDFRGRGLESSLLTWIEGRAREAVAKAPEGARVALAQGVPAEDGVVQELFRDRGYSVIRHFWRMAIDLTGDIAEPTWPLGVELRTLHLEDDLEETVRAYQDSFQDHWGHVDVSFEQELKQWDHWMRNDPEFDSTLTFLAVAGDEIVGLAKCAPKHSEDPAMGHIDVLGVRRGWRRRGIALALLRHVFREFRRRGQKRVGLGVDAASLTGAVGLYQAAGMAPTRQIDVFEKELRPGVDLSRQTLDGGRESHEAAS